MTVQLDSPLVEEIGELALFSILFSDGLKVEWTKLRRAWQLPGRALLVGMPLTAIAIAGTAHLLFPLPCLSALLLGVILSPTDPVFASAIVGRKEIPGQLRHLLNVESGVNDGLALPFVLLLALSQHTDRRLLPLLGEVAGGLAVGVVIAATVATIVALVAAISPSPVRACGLEELRGVMGAHREIDGEQSEKNSSSLPGDSHIPNVAAYV